MSYSNKFQAFHETEENIFSAMQNVLVDLTQKLVDPTQKFSSLNTILSYTEGFYLPFEIHLYNWEELSKAIYVNGLSLS